MYLGGHLTYRESQEVLRLQRIKLSLGLCEQKEQAYASHHEKACKDELKKQAKQALPAGGGKDWVIQIDGMFVMERDKPSVGQCEGREVKQAVLFPLTEPDKRHYASHAGDLKTFAELTHGLQRHQAMRQQDRLIAVADAAVWIDKLFDELGVEVRILDVIHASQYLDTVMQAMNWDETRRDAHRASWMRGDINARYWLAHYLPDPSVWIDWNEKAQTALRYLEQRLDQMDYHDFKQQNFPIASGVIEGAANSVIAARMRPSGMRWSFNGINRMATLRSEFASYNPILDFHEARLLAFP